MEKRNIFLTTLTTAALTFAQMTPAHAVSVSDHLNLRPIVAADHARHLTLMERIYPPAFAYLWSDRGEWYVTRTHAEPALLADLQQAHCPYWHVYWHGALAGIFRLQLQAACPDHPNEPALKLDRLYLAPEVRGQGIGKALIAFCEEHCRRHGKSILWLERMDTNEATIAFYRRCGFTDGGSFRLPFERMHSRFRGMHRVWLRVSG